VGPSRDVEVASRAYFHTLSSTYIILVQIPASAELHLVGGESCPSILEHHGIMALLGKQLDKSLELRDIQN
jgi:hypothetical protein